MQLSSFPVFQLSSTSQKWKFPKLIFFDTLTIQNDQISYVKHVLASLYVFFTLFGCGGGGRMAPKGFRAQPAGYVLMQFSSLGSSKMEISEIDFFLIF